MMPGHVLGVDPGGDQPIAEAQDPVGVEAVLGHQPAGTRLDLAAQVLEIGLGALGLGVDLGVAAGADLEVGHGLEPADQVGGIGVAVGRGV